jgi:hypothetical protein
MLFIVLAEAPTPITRGAFASRVWSSNGDWLGSSMPDGFLHYPAIYLDSRE